MSDNMESAKANAAGWLESIEEMLEDARASQRSKHEHLREREANDAPEQAQQAIEESVLEICVRDGWRMPGQPIEDGPEEYYVLLTTGGPALRIYGRLDEYNSPKSAELQMQDWGTPWTRYPAPEATLLAFAQHFYFGE